MITRTGGDLTATVLTNPLGADPAQAHGCDALWVLAYNITVRRGRHASPGEVAAAYRGGGR
jgi:hypothetical protein